MATGNGCGDGSKSLAVTVEFVASSSSSNTCCSCTPFDRTLVWSGCTKKPFLIICLSALVDFGVATRCDGKTIRYVSASTVVDSSVSSGAALFVSMAMRVAFAKSTDFFIGENTVHLI